MLKIRQAETQEYSLVRAFYYELIDRMQNAQYKPGWQKGVYPADEYLRESLDKGDLYIGLLGEEISAAMIINHQCNEGYQKAKWEVEAAADEVMMIHALGVMPVHARKGFGADMVNAAIKLARTEHQKAIRLDVLCGNLPAERLYTGMGFCYRETQSMFYEDTGWTDFLLFEYPVTY